MEDLIKVLKEYASKDACIDDTEFVTYDYCGGNIDDAFDQGTSDGYILLARDLLDKFFPKESY